MIGLMPLGLGMGGASDSSDTGQADTSKEVINTFTMPTEIKSAEELVQEIAMAEKKQDAGELYQVAKSYEEIYDFIEREAEEYYWYYNDVVDGVLADDVKFEAEVLEEAIAESITVSGATDKNLSSGSTEAPTSRNELAQDMSEELDYSKTNVQMVGVDESDIVKTNGTHIFSVKDGVVTITKVENGQMEKVGTIAPKLVSFSDTVLEMYVDGNRLMLIVQQAKQSLNKEPAAWGEGAVTDDIMISEPSFNVNVAVDLAYNFKTTYNTVLYTYDISNPEKPMEIGRMEQDGNYHTSRKIDDIIYLFTYDNVVMEVKDGVAAAELLPKVNGETFAYDSIYLPERGTQGLVISATSINNPSKIVDKTLILNNYDNDSLVLKPYETRVYLIKK